ncbi:MAG TPA: cyclase family protein [Candidatus Gracilibacteria bacterium]
MQIIDLTLPLSNDTTVYPGDPKVNIERIQTFEKDDWNMKRLQINGHDGTHVNAPIHGTADGKNLDDYDLIDFMGPGVKYETDEDLKAGLVIIFDAINITQELAEKAVKAKVKSVGLSDKFEFDVEVEKWLLEQGMISFERLANTEKLPKAFFFHGAPLKIKEGDGSPIRAYAIV